MTSEAPSAGATHTYEVRVGYADTDQGGVVHHSVYLRYLEAARVEFLRAQGLEYRALEYDDKLALPVVEARLKYRRPALFDQVLCIDTRVGRLSRATIRFDYDVRHGDELLCNAEVTLACVALPEMKLRRIPEQVERACTAG